MRLYAGLPGVEFALLSRLRATSRTRDSLDLFDCRTVATRFPYFPNPIQFADQFAVDWLRLARVRGRLDLFVVLHP